MTKDKAVHAFFNGFGVIAYPASNVPEDVVFPYATYEWVTGAWDSEPVGMVLNLWYYTTSEAVPNAKVQEIEKTIGIGGVMVVCDEGVIWFKKGSPWCQNLKDENDPTIKRRYLNITAEYMTLS